MWVDSCSTQLPLPPLVLCRVVSSLSLSLSLSLSVSLFLSHQFSFFFCCCCLHHSIILSFFFSPPLSSAQREFLFCRCFLTLELSCTVSLLSTLFHNKTLLYFLQAKKQGRARERDWETLGERDTQTQTFFHTVMWLRGRKQILLCFSWQWMFRTAGICHC